MSSKPHISFHLFTTLKSDTARRGVVASVPICAQTWPQLLNIATHVTINYVNCRHRRTLDLLPLKSLKKYYTMIQIEMKAYCAYRKAQKQNTAIKKLCLVKLKESFHSTSILGAKNAQAIVQLAVFSCFFVVHKNNNLFTCKSFLDLTKYSVFLKLER